MAHHNPASIAADEIAEFSSEDLMKKSCPKRSKLKKFQNLCKKIITPQQLHNCCHRSSSSSSAVSFCKKCI